MNKQDIAQQIQEKVEILTSFLEQLDAAAFVQTPNEKWTAAQQTQHLIKSVNPLNLALSLPKLTFLVYGKAKKHRNMEEVIKVYQDVLDNGGKSTSTFNPSSNANKLDKSKLIADLRKAYATYAKKIQQWTEDELDKYRVPHPLIGKLTMREMAYFTIYHIGFHTNSIKEINR